MLQNTAQTLAFEAPPDLLAVTAPHPADLSDSRLERFAASKPMGLPGGAFPGPFGFAPSDFSNIKLECYYTGKPGAPGWPPR
jgi:hypothetical protein